MGQSSINVRQRFLRPLGRRCNSPASLEQIEAAFRELEERAFAISLLPKLSNQSKLDREKRPNASWKDARTATSRIEMAIALYLARRISYQEYIFMVSQAAEGVLDGRITDKAYPTLERLSCKMQQFEKDLESNDVGSGAPGTEPAEYTRLNKRWEKEADRLLASTFRELGAHDVAGHFERDRVGFDLLRERGRRSFFHKDDFVPALVDTIRRYEAEARAAAQASAFTAAVTLLGAAMEGLLLLRCLRASAKAIDAAKGLPKKFQPKDPVSPKRWTLENLVQVCLHAGWLPRIDTPTLSIRPDGLADLLRKARNQIHPGRVCSDRPWIQTDRREFDDAELIYTTLYTTVFKGALLRKFVVAANGAESD